MRKFSDLKIAWRFRPDHRPADPVFEHLCQTLQAVHRAQSNPETSTAERARKREGAVWRSMTEYLATLDCDPGVTRVTFNREV
jgi:hypothetical protein